MHGPCPAWGDARGKGAVQAFTEKPKVGGRNLHGCALMKTRMSMDYMEGGGV